MLAPVQATGRAVETGNVTGASIRFGVPAALVGMALLQGCARKPTIVEAAPPAPDLYGRVPARACEVTPIVLRDGGESSTTMTVTNDGGYCAAALADGAGHPFEVGLVTAPPVHGKPLIHTVGGKTDIDYIPTRGFVGSDSFIVRLRTTKVDSLLHLTVVVTPVGEAYTSGHPAPPTR
jgi:hypothetical protein